MTSRPRRRTTSTLVALGLAVPLVVSERVAGQQEPPRQGFRFRSAVELINVTATVTDRSGRFVPGLEMDDFVVYEDGVRQEVTHFSNERVPVSLGIALDTSGSMAGDKIVAARQALDRFLYDLLDPADEIFLYRIGDPPDLIEEWTADRRRLSGALRGIRPRGGTALYDAVAESVPIAQEGHHRKKALLVISDGNDTVSQTDPRELKPLIRETEVLVYAIGIDGRGEPRITGGGGPTRIPIPMPFPIPGRRGPTQWPVPGGGGGGRGGSVNWGNDDRVNVRALRELTDESGGRTETVRDAQDLDPATSSIADELSKQYSLGYSPTSEKDGRWHEITVEVRGRGYTVRARKGYVATP